MKNCLVVGSFGENRKQTIIEFNVDNSFNEFAERLSIEFMTGNLSLKLPSFTVGAEDTVAEKITDGTFKRGTFVVAREVGFENMLHYGGVCCEDLAGTERAVEDEGGGRDGLEDVGNPVDTAVEVGVNGKNRTNDRVRVGDGGGCSGGGWCFVEFGLFLCG